MVLTSCQRQESPRATSKLEIEIATARSIAVPATGFASCKFGHCQNEYQIFLRTNFRTPEGQQQLLWKGLLVGVSSYGRDTVSLKAIGSPAGDHNSLFYLW
jgi:hypothetical protein